MDDSNKPAPAPSSAQEQLANLGIRIDVRAQLAALDLPEPQYGEEVVGELTDEETALFVELYETDREGESRSRDMGGEALVKAGQALKGGANPVELFQNGPEMFATEAEACDFFTFGQKRNMLHATLHWKLGERLGLHHWRLGVRQGGRVVKVREGRRY